MNKHSLLYDYFMAWSMPVLSTRNDDENWATIIVLFRG